MSASIPRVYKNIAHSLSAFLVGIAAGLYVVYLSYVHPNQVFGFDLSIGMVLMGVIGGVGTLWGPVPRRDDLLPDSPAAARPAQSGAFNLFIYRRRC